MRSRRSIHLLALSVLLLGLSASQSFAQAEPFDPWEKANRKFFAVQEHLDRKVFAPLSRAYSGVVPAPFLRGVSNFSQNLGEPVVFFNDVLQAHPGQAATTMGRFAINTLFGVAGFIDVAKRGRIPHRDNSFGTTLGRWGAQPGPYIFLPLIGPSTLRDSLGSGVDIALNPLTYARFDGKWELGAALTVSDGLQARISAGRDIETIRQTSTDPYATLRSYYLQNRQAEITGKTVDIETLPTFDETPEPVSPPSPTPEPSEQPPAPAPPLPETATPPAPPPPDAPAQFGLY